MLQSVSSFLFSCKTRGRKKPLLSEKELSLRIQPLEYGELKDAVVRAITLGYRRDIEEEDREIDLGLQELNEKKTKAGN